LDVAERCADILDVTADAVDWANRAVCE